MNLYFKVLGSVLVLTAALIFARGYSAYVKRRISQHEGFLSLLLHIKSKISCFLTPADELLSDFRCESLDESGFLPSVREGVPFREAYAAAVGKLALCEDTKKQLAEFFEGFGRGYKDGELARIEYYIDILKRSLEDMKVESEKNIKIVKTLLCAGALGLVILLI